MNYDFSRHDLDAALHDWFEDGAADGFIIESPLPDGLAYLPGAQASA